MNSLSFRKRSLLPLATLLVLARAVTPVLAQSETPSDYLQINAPSAQTFNDGTSQIIVVDHPLTIQTDGTNLSADSAVLWITPVPGTVLNRQRAEIALIGNATLVQPTNTRSGDRLFVSTVVGGSLRLCVQQRINTDPRDTALYKTAADIRPMILAAAERQDNLSIQRPWIDIATSQPATQPTTMPTPQSPVTFSAGDVQTTTNTPDGKIAVILRGNVLLMQRRTNGDLIELRSQECVLYTSLTNFSQMQNGTGDVQNAVTAAYLEGDVRINVTPSARPGRQIGEQRLRADRVFYEFGTDRAILTHVVLQTTDPRVPFPITMRANVAKQLSMGEYDTQKTTLTTSQFLDPSYSINADKVYVRQYNLNDGYGPRTAYQGDDVTFKVLNTPVFYLPKASGEFSQNGQAIRKLELGSARGSGVGVETQWGLFQSAGMLPPPGLDADYEVDYFSDRGPGFGFDTTYKGGQLAETTKDGWNFEGSFESYILPNDDGTDKLGHERVSIPHNNDTRYRVQWEHQQILPDDWQVQLRAGVVSDPTFLEEWYENQFNNGDPTNLSAYLKHQKDNEAVTFLLEYQPNGFVTNADALQNRFTNDRLNPDAPPGLLESFNDRPFEVDRLPEIGYYRLGDSLADDRLTFFSENRVGGYRMNEGDAILGSYGDDPRTGTVNNFDNGYGFEANPNRDRFSSPGIPSLGYTGQSQDWVLRGDSRQEIDYPIDAGQFKIVPYVMGRYTGYSDSPDGDPQNRVIAGTGIRMTTAFWKVDDSAESDFFDIHRVRHVIEPELNLFTSGATVDRNSVYIYDDTIDGINDISAASFWIRQRWQTKRGGPGLWRSVDFFTFDVGITGFANAPTDPTNPDRTFVDGTGPNGQYYPYRNRLGPESAKGFRGLFFESTPEASVPRSNIAAQSTWRLSDTTLLLGDASWNIQQQELATTAVGVLVGRGDRVTYYAGLRYIGQLDSTIASFSSTYQISAKYTLNFSAAVDLASTSSKGGSFSIIRKFDRFYMGIGAYYDAVEDRSGFTVSLYPEGTAGGVNTGQLQKLQQ
ncbi:MAG: LPS assembly protein LptD [Tepidisphaeraceae bacterium]